jgi:predicted Fe-Mo cluster-binding NifX family protein
MKIGIPTDDGKTVGKVFGRAKNFAIYDTEKKNLSILPNDGMNAEHGAGTGAAAFLAEQGVKTVGAPEVGPKAASALAVAGIVVKEVPAGTELKEAVKAL